MNELHHMQHEELVKWQDRALKSEAANREQKAEIERLKAQWSATDHTLKHDCSRALVALSGAGICTPAETYGVNTSWAISDLCRAVAKQSEELASLRASVGEKPEDAFERGFCEGVGAAMHKIEESVTLHPHTKLMTFCLECPPYIAPTLPGEEK